MIAAQADASRWPFQAAPAHPFAHAVPRPLDLSDDAARPRPVEQIHRAALVDVTEELSIGDYVLSGGELPALVTIDAIARLVPGVVGHERSVAEDTVRNEYLFHGHIHEWFAKGDVPAALDDLNERVYARLFLMPKSDPWLGLVPADTYTGLPEDAPR